MDEEWKNKNLIICDHQQNAYGVTVKSGRFPDFSSFEYNCFASSHPPRLFVGLRPSFYDTMMDAHVSAELMGKYSCLEGNPYISWKPFYKTSQNGQKPQFARQIFAKMDDFFVVSP